MTLVDLVHGWYGWYEDQIIALGGGGKSETGKVKVNCWFLPPFLSWGWLKVALGASDGHRVAPLHRDCQTLTQVCSRARVSRDLHQAPPQVGDEFPSRGSPGPERFDRHMDDLVSRRKLSVLVCFQ